MSYEALVEKLRRDDALVRLPSGREGVPVSVQFRGSLPPLDRLNRKQWLAEYFSRWASLAGDAEVLIVPDTVSPSAQTSECILPVDKLPAVMSAAAGSQEIRVDILRKLRAV